MLCSIERIKENRTPSTFIRTVKSKMGWLITLIETKLLLNFIHRNL
jgi:hypothetical protein